MLFNFTPQGSNMKKIIISLSVLLSLFTSTSILANAEFPGRAEYPEIPLYKKADLLRDLYNVVVVDARSSLEFETLRIKGAVNIPVASKTFAEQVKKLRSKTKKPIVFYCNGRTCYKSYKATKTALAAGVKKVFAYDAGVFEWAKTYPKYAVLLGENPMDPTKIIPKSELKKRFLSPKKFAETARSAPRSKVLILDVRDKYQRAGVGYFMGIERWASLDDEKRLNEYLQKALEEKRTLFIYDETGKQVRWLQYTLERANIKNYYFMAKGAKGFHKDMIM
jgi:rhodanese-related sulfurtransferase